MKALVAAALLLCAVSAHAAPPPGVNPNSPLGRWVRSLTDPLGVSCCSIADCRPVDVQLVRNPDGSTTWQALIERQQFGPTAPNAYVDVPWNVVRHTHSDGPPPNQVAWACWWGGRVRCLVLDWGA